MSMWTTGNNINAIDNTNDIDGVTTASSDPYHAINTGIRTLGSAADPVRIDYNALSVAAMTLTLILMVDFARDRLDRAARQRPFFRAVLEGVYTELATLGFVELLLHLIAEYYEEYDASKKHVFGDVHFLLFYCAILNAFQTVLTAVMTSRVAHAHWVTTELLELYHYVELREEFDRVAAELDRLHHSHRIPLTKSVTRDSPVRTDDHADASPVEDDSSVPPPLYDFGRRGLTAFGWAIRDSIRYPTLRRKYDTLLTQVRFHELRMHFLQSYNLPLQFKVSDYLMRSKHNVLLKFVNVSSTAWLLLTAGVCLLYYVMGMIYNESLDQELVGACLTWIFFGGLVVSLLALWVVSFKMHFIFHSIMHNKALWDIRGTSPEEKRRLAEEQKALFWVAEPKNVLEFVQFLQFGYSLAIATVIVFWEEINDGSVAMHWFVVVVGLCYAHFVFCTGTIIPMYILCTSLGQLVDERVLHSTVALFRLEEAKQKQLESEAAELEHTEGAANMNDEADNAGTNDVGHIRGLPPIDSVDMSDSDATDPLNTTKWSRFDNPIISNGHMPTWSATTVTLSRRPKSLNRNMHRLKATSDGVASMRLSLPLDSGSSLIESSVGSFRSVTSASSSKQAASIDDLFVGLSADQRLLQRRHARKKSLSDGVGMMARLSASGSHHSRPSSASHNPRQRTAARPLVRASKVETGDILATLVSTETTALREFLLNSGEGKQFPVSVPRPQRMSRQKSVSDGVTVMRAGLPRVSTYIDGVSIQSELAVGPTTSTEPNHAGPRTRRHDRKKSLSDGVSFMSDIVTWNEDGAMSLPTTTTLTIDSTLPLEQLPSHEAIDQHVPSIAESFCRSTEGALPPANGRRESSDKISHPVKLGIEDHTLEEGVPVSTTPPAISMPACQGASSEMLYAFFLSKQHVIVSNVFGTIAAFFMVGQRIEGFIYSDEIPDYFVSLHLPSKVSFFVLTALLTSFLVASALVMLLFRRYGNWRCINELTVLMAAAIDVFIVLVCLIVLIVAENNRCCHHDGDYRRILRILVDKADYPGAASRMEGSHTICSCPMFGKRSYGGLGTIEPYTSLVLLRIVRHWLGRRIAGCIIGRVEPSKLQEKTNGTRLIECDNEKSNIASAEVAVSVVEAWESIVGSRPDLVATYGEFSSEVLRAMLGVAQSKRVQKSLRTNNDDRNLNPTHSKVGNHNRSFSLNKEYAGLSDEAQEVILAGKLGRSLMRSSSNNVRFTRVPGQPVASEERTRMSPSSLGRSSESVLFEIATETDSRVLKHELLSTSPNARLICNMRRCERKFLPILNKWVPVDVVVTRFEILYLDAVGVDDVPLEKGGEGTRQALLATKGGKGLRLCDVALGRRVVGRLSLSDIVSLQVERMLPRIDDLLSSDNPDTFVDQTEFWMNSSSMSDDEVEPKKGEKRAAMWKTMAQDLLKIETLVGHTLFLRFYADADKVDNLPVPLSISVSEEFYREGSYSLQWAQLIGRICGREQLKQPLPHLGDSSPSELSDYLVVVAQLPTEGKGRYSRANSFRSKLKRNQSLWILDR